MKPKSQTFYALKCDGRWYGANGGWVADVSEAYIGTWKHMQKKSDKICARSKCCLVEVFPQAFGEVQSSEPVEAIDTELQTTARQPPEKLLFEMISYARQFHWVGYSTSPVTETYKIGSPAASIACLGLSAEIYLKALRFCETGDLVVGHDLLILYNDLTKEVRSEIVNAYGNPENILRSDLEFCRDSFAKWRYAYEVFAEDGGLLMGSEKMLSEITAALDAALKKFIENIDLPLPNPRRIEQTLIQ